MKAFTLMELLVAMALMAILSVLSFYAFQLVQQQYLLNKRIGDEVSTYQSFIALLQRDIQEAQYVERGFEQLILKKKRNHIHYFFRDSTVERLHSSIPRQIDTLAVRVTWNAAYFDKKIKKNGLIDYGVLDLYTFKEQQIFSFVKSYSTMDKMTAQSYINYEY